LIKYGSNAHFFTVSSAASFSASILSLTAFAFFTLPSGEMVTAIATVSVTS
jgi:hypothetical protein